jgi:hypothetical protein
LLSYLPLSPLIPSPSLLSQLISLLLSRFPPSFLRFVLYFFSSLRYLSPVSVCPSFPLFSSSLSLMPSSLRFICPSFSFSSSRLSFLYFLFVSFFFLLFFLSLLPSLFLPLNPLFGLFFVFLSRSSYHSPFFPPFILSSLLVFFHRLLLSFFLSVSSFIPLLSFFSSPIDSLLNYTMLMVYMYFSSIQLNGVAYV